MKSADFDTKSKGFQTTKATHLTVLFRRIDTQPHQFRIHRAAVYILRSAAVGSVNKRVSSLTSAKLVLKHDKALLQALA